MLPTENGFETALWTFTVQVPLLNIQHELCNNFECYAQENFIKYISSKHVKKHLDMCYQSFLGH